MKKVDSSKSLFVALAALACVTAGYAQKAPPAPVHRVYTNPRPHTSQSAATCTAISPAQQTVASNAYFNEDFLWSDYDMYTYDYSDDDGSTGTEDLATLNLNYFSYGWVIRSCHVQDNGYPDGVIVSNQSNGVRFGMLLRADTYNTDQYVLDQYTIRDAYTPAACQDADATISFAIHILHY